MDVTGNFNETLGALTLGANSTLSSNLANISFYSDSGTTSIGSGFEIVSKFETEMSQNARC